MVCVVLNRVIYLVATAWDYDDPHHFALHRFSKCEVLEEKASNLSGFDLDEYISTGAFDYNGINSKQIRVTLVFDTPAAYHLQETPLKHQSRELTHKKDGRVQIEKQL